MFRTRIAAGLLIGVSMLSAGCFEVGTGTEAPATPPPATQAESSAATLRQGLDSLLQEHVALVAQATDAALSGRNDDFNAATIHLDDNARELEGAVRTVYGEDAGLQFYNLWHTHIGYIVDYAQAVQANDEAKKAKAVDNLLAYATDLGGLLETISNGRMNHDMVADLIRAHIAGIKGVIDAQAAGDFASAYTDERDTVKQAAIIGNTWSNAIVQQFPEKY